jgi:pilus assembly protein CpaF
MLPHKLPVDKSNAKLFQIAVFKDLEMRSKMSEALDKVSRSVRHSAASGGKLNSSVLNEEIDREVESETWGGNLSQELELRRLAENRLFGFGKLQPLLDDESIEEIWVNGNSSVFVARSGLSSRVAITFEDGELAGLIERMLRPIGRRLDRSSPFVDASLPDGSRLHVAIPDITRAEWAVNIRKFPASLLSLEDLVDLDALSAAEAAFLSHSIRQGANVLVSGATQAGKTTLLCALLDSIDESERIVTVEETFEIRSTHPDWVAMQTRLANLEGHGEVSLRRLIKEALRMRPSRLVVGEVREAEALDLLIALNSGIPGLCTIHANSAPDALLKLATLPLLAGQNISSAFTIPTVASCVDLVVHCRLESDGRRRIEEIRKVSSSSGEIHSERVTC